MHFKDLDVVGWVNPKNYGRPVRARADTMADEGTPTPGKASIAWRPEIKSVDIPKRGSRNGPRLADGVEPDSIASPSRACTGEKPAGSVIEAHSTSHMADAKVHAAKSGGTKTGKVPVMAGLGVR